MRLVLVILSFVALAVAQSGLQVVYQWKYLDWVYPSIELTGKSFIFGNAFTIDVDIDKTGRTFVSSPQWHDGVPISLSLMTPARGPGGPLLTPYPDWTWHTSDDCDRLISVFRVAIDECNRLWLVDVGRRGQTVLCPMKIMIFDLATDTLIHKYIIPDDQAVNGKAELVNPIVELGETCDDAYLYVSDLLEYGMVVYDYRNDFSWRINNTLGNAFGFDPEATNITIAGEMIYIRDGIFGISLSPPGFFKERYLYFNSLASFYQKVTDVNSLKYSQYIQPTILRSIFKRPSQAGIQAISRRGVLFFQLAELTAVACWNINSPFAPEYIEIVHQDEETLQYVSGMKVIVNKNGEEELWLTTNRLQKIINNTRNPGEINYRILRGFVDDLIHNTVCETQIYNGPYLNTAYWQRI